ncbi:hypothetical protein CDL15_Pgr012270 [Punica granatum]|uniref:Uncharacterized protein n=1 Tax=Punica granatum TaxID=22663 RepID=A0A218WSH3_PUNGR|nr:hypothetical protein CDL15_Pgr012270 [Punica granatum]
MDKNDPLVPHTSCGLGILNGSGQIIYSNMILDQPSSIAQPSSAKDSSSSTVGKPSMPSKQFGITYTTEEQRKRATLQQAITEPKSQIFLSKSLVITLWKWYCKREELRGTLIPDQMGYVGAHSLELESRRTRFRILANFQQVKVRLPKPVKLISSNTCL